MTRRARRRVKSVTHTPQEHTGRRFWSWRSNRALLWGSVGGGILLVLLMAWSLRRQPQMELPELPLDGVQPRVAKYLRELYQTAASNPVDGRRWGEVGLALYVHGMNQAAIPWLHQAEVLEPHDPRWPYFQGLCALGEMDARAAVEHLRRAAATEHHEPIIWVRLANVLFDLEQWQECQDAARRALELDPRDWQAEVLLGRVAAHDSDLPTAWKWAKLAVEHGPRARPAYELLAQISHQMGHTDEAEQALQTLQHLPGATAGLVDPLAARAQSRRRDSEWLLTESDRLLAEGRISEAIKIREELVADEPDRAEFYGLLGKAYQRAGDLRLASSVLDKGLQRCPDVVELLTLRGVVHLQLQEIDDATRCFNRAIQLKPDYANAYFNLGLALRQQHRTVEAEAALLRATELKPSYIEAHAALGVTRRDRGDLPGAIAALETAARLDPNQPNVLLNLAPLYLESGRRDEARKMLDTAAQLAPNDPRVQPLRHELDRQP